MNIDKTKYRLPKGKFFADTHTKDMIVLHFTAGSTTSGAFASWMSQKINIGTPYILDPDGTVYEIFDPKCWAYHLGMTGPHQENWKHDKRSVPIEVVNFGPLKLVGDTLYSWPNGYKNVYCKLTDADRYVKKSYRGFDYYAAFTDAQKVALVELVKHISDEFKIPMDLPPADKLEKFDTAFFKDWKGIASHQNFRSDKFDMGPAWDWDLLR